MGRANSHARLDEGQLVGLLGQVGQQLENHAPLSPYCLKVRLLDAKSLFTPPWVEVLMPFRKDAGTGWPASLKSSGL